MAKKEGVVSWFDVPGQENRGVILELGKGNHWFLKGEDYDDATKAQLVRDNIFEFDSAPDPKPGTKPGQKGYDRLKVSDLVFQRKAAKPEETADYHEQNFPQKKRAAGATTVVTGSITAPITVGPQQPVVVKPQSDPNRPVKLEIYGTPIGGEDGNRWKISFEVEGRDGNRLVPIQGVSVRLEYHSGTLKGVTDKEGCFTQEIEINKNEYARGYINAVLSVSNIPLAGPENAQQHRQPKTGFARWNNWLFLVVIVVVISAFVYNLYSAVNYLNTPLGQAQQTVQQPDRNKKINDLLPFTPKDAEQKSLKPTQPQPNLPAQALGWLPYGSWFMWIMWFVFMIILIPICFYDEAYDAALAVYQRGKRGVDMLFHTRNAFRVGIEELPDGSTEMIVNGQESQGLKTKKEAIGEVAAMSFRQLFAKVAVWDFALELAYKALGGLVKTIFGGR